MTTRIHPEEQAKFNQLASQWWDTEGPMQALHALNPVRMAFIQEALSLRGKKILDAGCGGGILCESLAQEGALVTGLDMAEDVLKTAELHLLESKIKVQYVNESIDEFSKKHAGEFDAVCCMEMLEHTSDPESVIQALSTLLKPNGHLFLSTINRTLRAYVEAIIGAEYVLKLLPKNTHRYDQFIKPSELQECCERYGLMLERIQGIQYSPFTKKFSIAKRPHVNYLMYFVKK